MGTYSKLTYLVRWLSTLLMQWMSYDQALLPEWGGLPGKRELGEKNVFIYIFAKYKPSTHFVIGSKSNC